MADILIKNVTVYDGSGVTPTAPQDVAISGDKIIAIGEALNLSADQIIDGSALALAPGFIDVHTHDDIEVIRNPEMLSKISQGVTSVIVGNCGISASPLTLDQNPPDPLNLLGRQDEFKFASFGAYVDAYNQAQPAINVAALIGHTALRAQAMTNLDQPASASEIAAMREALTRALEQGAKGLSSGLAYANANAAPAAELQALAEQLAPFNGIYTTHLRTEFDGILDAMSEAFDLGQATNTPVVISHLKCAGTANWGRSTEILAHLAAADVPCDCYPYSASSSTLDLAQVTDEFEIFITWSDPHPQVAGQPLQQIADLWQMSLIDAAKKLQPAGAVYHCMDNNDVEAILRHDNSMIGSDGLPCDPHPHPRLWGTFPRVLGHYARDKQLFSLAQAVHKMTGASADTFTLNKRGYIRPDYFADLVLFDPLTVNDEADYLNPTAPARGIVQVWVNGQLSFERQSSAKMTRAGRFLKNYHSKIEENND
ncbi:MAG: N-acyl-D-aspartate/D-glutamate deacylase [Phenylobacterium sp.]|jgi:N-acyl-D-aspartate/D-glutamate deacylase